MARIAMLGLGEAGGRIAADLVARGVDVRGYDPAVSSVEGVECAADPASAVADATVVLSLTTAAAARDVAAAALPGLRPDALYADLNAAGPELKRELAVLVPSFVDVALLGAVTMRGLGTPALASGPGAERFAALFEPLGMPVDVVSDRPGEASALKLLRSVFMKGIAAAALESLAAAEAAGRREWLEAQLGDVLTPVLLRRLVEGSRRHAARRVDELNAACELLASLGVEPRIAAASRAILAELGE
jgi:3-hydroxyisobutyrate dehydrogenase-like beta-hydroxyacid dehydrogenase